jgi:predicted HTH transcriptional regulator
MLTEDDIRKALAAKSETANVDYKEGFSWTSANRDKKYELVKDLMAMANTKDGGRVIMGIRNKTFELVGVADDVYEPFDPNNVVLMAHDSAEPKIVCHVSKHVIDGEKLIVLDVQEFDDTPIN